MDAGSGDLDVWRRLGRIAFDRRRELHLTQKQLAVHAGVSLGTVTRLETGARLSRRGPSWAKLEIAYGWAPGFIEDFVTGQVTTAPRTGGDADHVWTPQSDGDVVVRNTVRSLMLKYAPDITFREVLEAEEATIAALREGGVLAPEHYTPDVDVPHSG